ncbi:MAG TPA: AbrB/MazE/SpoVT family DNA-binding domain-containing protein [Spirochaetota bacterium]|nr:AbrB/MazE/SpoVT family DNA-binding domain-containing protein [Spirochaetota bacterium]HOH38324.1 AbrB/MazE/SpoVT family DNA-binding domain-containing protein [Spirochaetota bacterium]
MEVVIKKWGNSLGVVIPKVIANDFNLKDGSSVEIENSNGNIIISPKRNNLSDMLSRINSSNIHDEADFGQTSGKEIW